MNYIISGEVVRGDGYGKKIGFPTVNLKTKKSQIKEFPPEGVYAGFGVLDGKKPRTRASSVRGKYKAGIVIGPNSKIEAHLIGYDGNAYGKSVTLEINKFLREFKKFDTEQKLIIQIKKDIDKC